MILREVCESNIICASIRLCNLYIIKQWVWCRFCVCVCLCECVVQGDNRQSDGAVVGAKVLLFRGGVNSLRRELQDTSRELSDALFNSNCQVL